MEKPPQSQTTMESPTTGIALAKLVITVAKIYTNKEICTIFDGIAILQREHSLYFDDN